MSGYWLDGKTLPKVVFHPLTDAIMGVSSGAMIPVHRERIRPHGLQVLWGRAQLTLGYPVCRVMIGSVSHSLVM